jgi:hypothetical protein
MTGSTLRAVCLSASRGGHLPCEGQDERLRHTFAFHDVQQRGDYVKGCEPNNSFGYMMWKIWGLGERGGD